MRLMGGWRSLEVGGKLDWKTVPAVPVVGNQQVDVLGVERSQRAGDENVRKMSITFPALVIFEAACAHAAAPPAPLSTPPRGPPAPARPAAPALAGGRVRGPLPVGVVGTGVRRGGRAPFAPATGDTLYEGRRFAEAFPVDSTYAASARWYHDHGVVRFHERLYVSQGLPRVLRPGDLEVRGDYRGLTVFAEPVASRSVPEVLYVAVRPTCEFQPYMTEFGQPVRGG